MDQCFQYQSVGQPVAIPKSLLLSRSGGLFSLPASSLGLLDFPLSWKRDRLSLPVRFLLGVCRMPNSAGETAQTSINAR